MRARIVDRRTHHRGAIVVGVAGMALASAFSLLFDRGSLAVGVGFLAASVAPFLFRYASARPAGDELERLRSEDVARLSLVRAKLGWSRIDALDPLFRSRR